MCSLVLNAFLINSLGNIFQESTQVQIVILLHVIVEMSETVEHKQTATQSQTQSKLNLTTHFM